jgi:hypothetical protein
LQAFKTANHSRTVGTPRIFFCGRKHPESQRATHLSLSDELNDITKLLAARHLSRMVEESKRRLRDGYAIGGREAEGGGAGEGEVCKKDSNGISREGRA